MLTPEQLELRRKTVGSSDVAAIWPLFYGGDRIDMYRDARDIYYSKANPENKKPVPVQPTDPRYWGFVEEHVKDGVNWDIPSDAMIEGTLLEPSYLSVAQYYLGKKHPTIQIIPSRTFGYDHTISANVDGVCIRNKIVVEIKRVNDPRVLSNYGRANTENVPRSVYLQVQHQLLCCGGEYKLAYILADRIDGRGIGIYPIKRDDDVIAMIEKACHDFMEQFVIPRIPPPSWAELQAEQEIFA